MSAPVLWTTDDRGVATVALNRPEVNNAYNGDMIQGLLTAMDQLRGAADLRVVMLKARPALPGRRTPQVDPSASRQPIEENVRVSRATAQPRPPQPAARAHRRPRQGGCFCGGTGIVAACDVVIAADNAIFSIAEVRWAYGSHHRAPARRRHLRAPVAPLCAHR